jgi:hypothetical protein
MPFRFVPVNPGTNFDQAMAVMNNNFAQLDNEAVTKVFKKAGGKPGFIEGKLPDDIGYGFLLYDADDNASIAAYIDADGQPILKVAKTGYDATTTTDGNLAFNSTKSFTVVLNDTYTIPATTVAAFTDQDLGLITIPHNLGYSPGVNLFGPNSVGGNDTSGYFPAGFPQSAQTLIVTGGLIFSPLAIRAQVFYGVDATNLYIGVVIQNSAGGSLTMPAITLTYYVYTFNSSI